MPSPGRAGRARALRRSHLDAERATLHIGAAIAETGHGTVDGPTETHAKRRFSR
jgi:hypothetical protein